MASPPVTFPSMQMTHELLVDRLGTVAGARIAVHAKRCSRCGLATLEAARRESARELPLERVAIYAEMCRGWGLATFGCLAQARR